MRPRLRTLSNQKECIDIGHAIQILYGAKAHFATESGGRCILEQVDGARRDGQDDKGPEQKLGGPGEGSCEATKAEKGSDKGEDEEESGVVQHEQSWVKGWGYVQASSVGPTHGDPRTCLKTGSHPPSSSRFSRAESTDRLG